MTNRNMPDIVGAMAVFLFGLFFLLYAVYGLRIGTAGRMGPGYFPATLGVLAMGVSAVVIAMALRRPGAWPQVAWRPAFWILAGVVAFIATLGAFGLVPAVFATVVVSSRADRASTPAGTAVLATVVAALCWAIFSLGLGMTVPAFRMPF